MAQLIPPPDPHSLIPPLLACLPTSFASSKPPPALLTQLSPILRQRLTLFTSSGSAHESWLRLLCWDASKAERIKEVVENANFEPHPASGELEVGDIERISYKRFDSETLKVQIPLNDWDLTALFLWCTGSEEGDAWRLAELLPYDSDLSQDSSWSGSITVANQNAGGQGSSATAANGRSHASYLAAPRQEDDDDDYWAQYDKTPNTGTPARQGSIVPTESKASEADYYARYADVQPAMDNYDPDEHNEEITQTSTLGGNDAQHVLGDSSHFSQKVEPIEQDTLPSSNRAPMLEDEEITHISHPVPSSPSSRAGSDAIARLESSADRYSASEIAIKQHISYSVKSMYRLAKGAGISKQEFEDMVQRELETLSILDRED